MESLKCGNCGRDCDPAKMSVCSECGTFLCPACRTEAREICPHCYGHLDRLC